MATQPQRRAPATTAVAAAEHPNTPATPCEAMMTSSSMLFTQCSIAGDDESSEKQTLNLSKQQLKKVPKQDDAQNIRKLILDENELQKIDNIDSYQKIETVS